MADDKIRAIVTETVIRTVEVREDAPAPTLPPGDPPPRPRPVRMRSTSLEARRRPRY